MCVRVTLCGNIRGLVRVEQVGRASYSGTLSIWLSLVLVVAVVGCSWLGSYNNW